MYLLKCGENKSDTDRTTDRKLTESNVGQTFAFLTR